jgi:hypothetical protein
VYYASDGSFGLAKVGRHRMFGLELLPGTGTGWVTTIGLRPPKEGWKRHKLTVNASGLRGGGRLEAELIDVSTERTLDGFKLEECLSIETDGVDLPVRWRGPGAILPDVRTPLRLRVRLTRGNESPQLHAVYLRKV